MNLPKDFEEYLKKGIIRKGLPDKSRAEFLIKGAKNSFDGIKQIVEKTGINEKTANNIIKNCYDLLMELLRAKLLLKGYISSGNFSHEAEVSYLNKLGFSENEISFLNDLRYFRNSITYYGKILNQEYALKVFDFLNKIYPKLNNL
ncbi:MAG: hypothetical protein AABY06_03785 [Nanoarchaeota archaeon]|mgnify:FL=1